MAISNFASSFLQGNWTLPVAATRRWRHMFGSRFESCVSAAHSLQSHFPACCCCCCCCCAIKRQTRAVDHFLYTLIVAIGIGIGAGGCGAWKTHLARVYCERRDMHSCVCFPTGCDGPILLVAFLQDQVLALLCLTNEESFLKIFTLLLLLELRRKESTKFEAKFPHFRPKRCTNVRRQSIRRSSLLFASLPLRWLHHSLVHHWER